MIVLKVDRLTASVSYSSTSIILCPLSSLRRTDVLDVLVTVVEGRMVPAVMPSACTYHTRRECCHGSSCISLCGDPGLARNVEYSTTFNSSLNSGMNELCVVTNYCSRWYFNF